jgi:S1-C subfamily serine protease
VVIETWDAAQRPAGQGTGVVIGRGEVITNCHVVHGAAALKVRGYGVAVDAAIHYRDTDRDLCQLSAPGLQAAPVALGSVRRLEVGQRVYAIGAPQGLAKTMSEGIVSSLRPYEGSHYVQTSAPISPGSSGGGLFDARGRLIGITTMQIAEAQNLNFAVPADWIRELPARHEQEAASESDMAIQAQREVLRVQPTSIRAWVALGLLYRMRGETDRVAEVYGALSRLDPQAAGMFALRVEMAAQ